MPVVHHPTHAVLDPSKITTFLDCPRKFFYQYVLGWQSAVENHHLVFGTAFHKALEVLTLEPGNVKDAYRAFREEYEKSTELGGGLDTGPKNSGSAMNAIVQYAEHYKRDDERPLYTEIAGTVPIGVKEDGTPRVLHFRLDNILERRDIMKLSRDHKTGSTPNRQWTDKWSLSMQMHTYLHVLYSIYPSSEVYGIVVNGIFFGKTGKTIEFERVNFRKTVDQMNAWLWEVNHYVDMIEWNMELLEKQDENAISMNAFPRNPESCTKYFGCPFLDYCNAWPNPLKRADEAPSGMTVRFWDPRDDETKAKTIINLEKPADEMIVTKEDTSETKA